MKMPYTRKATVGGSQLKHTGSQKVSSNSKFPSIYVTREKMENIITLFEMDLIFDPIKAHRTLGPFRSWPLVGIIDLIKQYAVYLFIPFRVSQQKNKIK